MHCYATYKSLRRADQLNSTVTIHTEPHCTGNPEVELHRMDHTQYNTRKCPHCFKVRAADVKLLAEATLRYHGAQCACDACGLARRILL